MLARNHLGRLYLRTFLQQTESSYSEVVGISESIQPEVSHPNHLREESPVGFGYSLGELECETFVPKGMGKTRGSKDEVGSWVALVVEPSVVVPEVPVVTAELAEVLVVARGIVTQAVALGVAPAAASEPIPGFGLKVVLVVFVAQPKAGLC